MLSLITVGCFLSPGYEELTERTRPVRLILDSVEVQHLISQQESFNSREREEMDHYTQESLRLGSECDRQPTGEACHRLKELLRNGMEYIPERAAFLDAMAREPSIRVAANSYCRVVKRSTAKCCKAVQDTCTFVKLRVTTGPSKGTEGWGCEGENVYSAWPMP
jgi:hypothetical protein